MDASFETAKYPGYTTKELRDVLTRTPDHPRADLINEEIERREAVAAGDMTKATPGERLRAIRKVDGVQIMTDHKRFTHNSDDTIYHQQSPSGMRYAFLVVSEFFDTPSEGVTKTLQFICDKLNESERDKS